jgi:hypothetical protein
MIALYAVWYNLCRIHKSLRVSPAIAAGVADRLGSMVDGAEMIEAGMPEQGGAGFIRSELPRNNGELQWSKIRRLNGSAATSFLGAGG